MDTAPNSPTPFVELLQRMASLPPDEAGKQTHELRVAFLQATSDSDDNRSCIAQIDYGGLSDRSETSDRRAAGLRLQRTGWGLADILWSAEDSPVPESVQHDFPGIRQEEWDAVLRFATCLLASFEGLERESG